MKKQQATRIAIGTSIVGPDSRAWRPWSDRARPEEHRAVDLDEARHRQRPDEGQCRHREGAGQRAVPEAERVRKSPR